MAVNNRLEFAALLERQHRGDLGRRRPECGVHDQLAEFGRGGRVGHVEGEAVQGGDGLRRRDAGVLAGGLGRDRGAGGRRQVAGVAEPLLDLQPVGLVGRLGRPDLRRVGQLGQVLDEHELHPADAQIVQGLEGPVAADLLAVDVRAVEAAEVADEPPVGVGEHLGVLPAAQVVAQDDPVRRGPAQRVAGPVGERVNVAEPVVAADDEERGGGGRHGAAGLCSGRTPSTIGRPGAWGKADPARLTRAA